MHPQIHLIDETWIDAPVDKLAAVVANPDRWWLWWPTLDLTVARDRGGKGIQWVAVSRAGVRPKLSGTVEIWLEPLRSGAVLHHFVRLDPIEAGQLSRRSRLVTTRRLAWHAKRVFWALKDELESGPPGVREKP
jgi:hypothetical protein